MNAFTGSKPNYKQNCTYLCRLETHIARDLFGCNSGGLLKIGEKRERRKAPPARRRVRVLSFWRNFLVVVVLLTLGLLRFVVHSFWRFRWERGFVGVREENRNERFYSSLRNIIHSICCVVFVSILFWSWMKDATVCWQKQCDAMPNVVFRGFKHTNDGISRRRFCVTFMCVFKWTSHCCSAC